MNKILIIIYFMKTHCNNHYTILCRQLVRVELTQCLKATSFIQLPK